MRLMYLLHGLGGSRDGSVRKLAEALKRSVPGHWGVSRPQLPHGDRNRTAGDSVAFLHHLGVPPGSLLVGISLGGLAAAKLQEEGRADLHVIAISSPTSGCGISLSGRMNNRVALYSSLDAVIEGRTANWPMLGRAYDLPWLTHDTDRHVSQLTQIVAAYLNGEDLDTVIKASQLF